MDYFRFVELMKMYNGDKEKLYKDLKFFYENYSNDEEEEEEEEEEDFYFEVYLPVRYFKIGGATKEEARQNMIDALKEYCEVGEEEIKNFLIRELPKELIPEDAYISECRKNN